MGGQREGSWERPQKSPRHTWVALARVQVVAVAAADAGGVQGVNAEGGELAPQLLDVALLAVQRHLKLQSHLVLLRQQLGVKSSRVSLPQQLARSSSRGDPLAY